MLVDDILLIRVKVQGFRNVKEIGSIGTGIGVGVHVEVEAGNVDGGSEAGTYVFLNCGS